MSTTPPPKVFTGTKGNDFIKIGSKSTDAKNIDIFTRGGDDKVQVKGVTGKHIRLDDDKVFVGDTVKGGGGQDQFFITQSTNNVIRIDDETGGFTVADKTASSNTYKFFGKNRALIEGNQNTVQWKASGRLHITGDSNTVVVRDPTNVSTIIGEITPFRVYVEGVGNRLDIDVINSCFEIGKQKIRVIEKFQLDLLGQGMQVLNNGVITTGGGNDVINVGGSFDTRPVTFKTGEGNDTIQFYDGAKGSFVVEKGAEKVTLPDSYKEQDRQGDYRVFQNSAGDSTVKVEQSIPVEFASNAAPPEPPAPPFDVTADFA